MFTSVRHVCRDLTFCGEGCLVIETLTHMLTTCQETLWNCSTWESSNWVMWAPLFILGQEADSIKVVWSRDVIICVCHEFRYLNFHGEVHLVVRTLVPILTMGHQALQDHSMWGSSSQEMWVFILVVGKRVGQEVYLDLSFLGGGPYFDLSSCLFN